MISYQTALVTGASSPLGKALCKLLREAGVFTIGLGRDHSLDSVDEYIRHDLTFPLTAYQSQHKIDVVFHLAAGPGSRKAIKDNPLQIANSNVIDFHVLKYVEASGITNLVYASSATARESVPLENGGCQPDTLYGWQKRLSEEILQALSLQTGVKVSIARMFTLYGKEYSSQGLIGFWIKQAELGQDIGVWGPDVFRSLIHVNDAASALMALSTSPGVFIRADVGSPDILSLLEIAQLIRFHNNPRLGSPSNIVIGENVDFIPNQICDLLVLSSMGWVNKTHFADFLKLKS